MVDLSKFKEIFLLEAEGNLEKLNEYLLKFEKLNFEKKDPDKQKEYLDELMRSSHTIKGSSATMGFLKLGFLAHVMEDVFDQARCDNLVMSTDLINKVFVALDKMKSCLESIKMQDKEIELDEFSNDLKSDSGVDTEGTGKSKRRLIPPPSLAPKQSGAEIAAEVKAEIAREQAEKERQAKAQTDKAPEKSVPAEPIAVKVISETSNKEEQTNRNGALIMSSSAVVKIDYIKVSVKRLDTLMELVEELLIDKMRLERMRNKIPEIKDLSDHISLLTSGIQHQVMQARLVPVDQVFQMFPRMVRDLAQQLEKKVNFNIYGGEIELDRTIVDKLGEPLVHLLRNAVDHGLGIEGTVRLEAIRENDYVLIVVENNGKSIDFNKVKQAAVSRGIVSEKEIESYNEDQLVNLLFHGRLSTKEAVTEISGRGIGLSVVKNFVDELNGHINIENIATGGTRFILKLPLTLAIINSLLVKVKDQIFAIPFTNIERSVSIRKDKIKKMADNEMAIIDGVDIPLIRLADIFNLTTEEKPETTAGIYDDDFNYGFKGDPENLTIVIIKKNKELVGVVVDSLISRQEIIIKPLSPVLRGTKGLAGSTILGDGKTILIIDILNLLKTI